MEILKPINKIANETPVPQFINSIIESIGIIHAMHLTTNSYARHKALDSYYKEMPDLIDIFAEAYIARNEVKLNPKINFEYLHAGDLLQQLCDAGCNIHPALSPDLSNPLEDILTLISTTLYKLKLV